MLGRGMDNLINNGLTYIVADRPHN